MLTQTYTDMPCALSLPLVTVHALRRCSEVKASTLAAGAAALFARNPADQRAAAVAAAALAADVPAAAAAVLDEEAQKQQARMDADARAAALARLSRGAPRFPQPFERAGASYVFDMASGVYRDPVTGFSYDPRSRLYTADATGKAYVFDAASEQFREATSQQQQEQHQHQQLNSAGHTGEQVQASGQGGKGEAALARTGLQPATAQPAPAAKPAKRFGGLKVRYCPVRAAFGATPLTRRASSAGRYRAGARAWRRLGRTVWGP